MNITEEMLAKAKTATSAAELQAMAKEFNIELTDEDAAEYFDFLNGKCKVSKDGLQELSSAELTMVAGGKGDNPKKPDPRYHVGQELWIFFETVHKCLHLVITEIGEYSSQSGYLYKIYSQEYPSIESFYLETTPRVYTYDPLH